MFTGYEGYLAVAICLFCTWLGYKQGKRNGIECTVDSMVELKLLKILNNLGAFIYSTVQRHTSNSPRVAFSASFLILPITMPRTAHSTATVRSIENVRVTDSENITTKYAMAMKVARTRLPN